MSDWEAVRLDALAADEKSAISKPYGSAMVKDDYRSTGVPVVRGVNLAGGTFHDDDFVFIEPALADRIPGANMRAGDLVVTHRGTVGQVSMIPRAPRHERYVASTSHVKVRLDATRAVPEFFYYWFQSARGRDSILVHSSTVGVPGIAQPVTTVKGLTVPFPPIGVQRGIAQVLGALDDKIAANSGVVTTADALAASLTRSVLDMTRQVALNEIALVTMGSSPPGTSYNEVGEGTVFYQGVRDFGVRYPDNRVWTTEPVRMAKAGDCLLSVRAPVGRLNLSAEDTCIGRGLASVRSLAATPMTLFHLLRDAPEAWAPYEAEGTIFGSINKDQLEALRLPTVPEEFVEGLEQQLRALEASVASCLDENLKLAGMRDALLPQLMSGKIRVKDAEQMVGDVV